MTRHKLFTDGACRGNPGPGGWGIYWEKPDGKADKLGGGKEQTTNNEMELLAVVRALEWVEGIDEEIEIHTDSQYVQKGMTEWIQNWQRRGWKTADNKPVANRPLWEEILEKTRAHGKKVHWIWVRGHDGNYGNEQADLIAQDYADSIT